MRLGRPRQHSQPQGRASHPDGDRGQGGASTARPSKTTAHETLILGPGLRAKGPNTRVKNTEVKADMLDLGPPTPDPAGRALPVGGPPPAPTGPALAFLMPPQPPPPPPPSAGDHPDLGCFPSPPSIAL